MTTARDAALSATAGARLPGGRRGFAGWADILHGGVVATLLDEAMAHAAIAAGVRAMTAKLEIRFRKPAPVGTPLTLEGTIVHRRGKVLDAEAVLTDGAGTVYAEGRSRFIAA